MVLDLMLYCRLNGTLEQQAQYLLLKYVCHENVEGSRLESETKIPGAGAPLPLWTMVHLPPTVLTAHCIKGRSSSRNVLTYTKLVQLSQQVCVRGICGSLARHVIWRTVWLYFVCESSEVQSLWVFLSRVEF